MEEGLENENRVTWNGLLYIIPFIYASVQEKHCPLNTFIFMFLDVCCINWNVYVLKYFYIYVFGCMLYKLEIIGGWIIQFYNFK